MTKDEFKAWFDGFSEGIEKSPTEKQWERIKQRVAEIDGAVTTYSVFVDRYVNTIPYPKYWWNNGQPYSSTTYANQAQGLAQGLSTAQQNSYSSANAMYSLGAIESQAKESSK